MVNDIFFISFWKLFHLLKSFEKASQFLPKIIKVQLYVANNFVRLNELQSWDFIVLYWQSCYFANFNFLIH